MALRYVLRFSTPDRAVAVGEVAGSIPWAAGDVIPVRGGLVMQDEPRVAMSDGLESVRVQLIGDPLGLLAGGPVAAAVTAELALIEDGADWDARETVISGARPTALSQELGGGSQAMTLTRDLVADSAVALEDYTIHDSYRNRVAPSGAYYNQGEHDRPWPIAVGVCYGIPLIRWRRSNSEDIALIVGHHLPASDMVVYDRGVPLTPSGRYTATPSNLWMTQGAGASPSLPPRAYARIDGIDGTGNINGASWEDEDGTKGNYCQALSTRTVHGGIRNARNETTITAGEVLEYLLEQSGIAVDWPRLAPTLQRLHSWSAGLYIDGRESWVAIIRDRLLPVLPLREHQSDDGIWYSYHVPAERRPRGTIVDGSDFSHAGQIEWDMRVINAVTVRYAYDYSVSDYTRMITVGPDQSTLCAASASPHVYGLRATPQPVTTTAIHTESAAIQAARVLAEANAMPRRRFSVMLRSAAWSSLQPGETLLVESGSLGSLAVLCQVLDVPRRRWPGRVTLETVPRTAQAMPA